MNHFYRTDGIASVSAINWLNFVARERRLTIHHANNRGEFMIQLPDGVFYADGYSKETNTIFEFYGDYWHGNPLLYKPEDINLECNKSFGQLYYETLMREYAIRSMGFTVITIWESAWKELHSRFSQFRKNKFKHAENVSDKCARFILDNLHWLEFNKINLNFCPVFPLLQLLIFYPILELTVKKVEVFSSLQICIEVKVDEKVTNRRQRYLEISCKPR
jgi:hypothetical protein